MTKRSIFMCCLLMVLSACQLPGRGDQPALYRLVAVTQFEQNLPIVKPQLLIEQPTAPNALNSARIALIETPLRLDYYGGVAWTGPVPEVLQSLLMESFENSGAIQAVGLDASGLRPDLILKLDLRDFQMETFDKRSPTAHVSMTAKLISATKREIMATHTFDAEVPVQGGGFENNIAAFDIATKAVLSQIVVWTLNVAAS